MAALHRALFTWFSGLLFLIFLGLRLDGKTSWDWFVVFTPMWFFDSILLFYVSFRFAAQCRSGSAGCGQVNGGSAASASAGPSTTTTSATASSAGGHSRRRNDHLTTTFTSAINAGNVVTVRGSRSSSNAPGGRTSSWLASVALKSCFLVGVLLKMTFQAAVCVTLQYPEANVPLRYVFVPLWLLLVGLCIGVFRDLIHMCRY